MERSGHAFIKRRMIEGNCLLGCEASGHYFFRELCGGDDGLFAALLMTELISRCGTLQNLRKSLPLFLRRRIFDFRPGLLLTTRS